VIYVERLDGTFAAAAPISIEKARSAAVFQRPTADFESAIRNGRVSLVANAELLPLQGGVPIVAGGQVIGAIGVSGAASAQQDEELAQAGAASLVE
jgi:glc operon protein GlcG